MNTARIAACFVLSSLATAACSSNDSLGAGTSTPRGAVARDAAQAFPNAPSSVPTLSRAEIAASCERAAECAMTEPADGKPLTRDDAVGLVVLCVEALTFSGERAIPISGWSTRAATADVWASCVSSASTCSAVRDCDVARDRVICEEDGCRGPADWVETSCLGKLATIVTKSGDIARDCSLAHATCDAKSPTGCTDRPYTQCPSDLGKADRCDGDVRLGCDGAGQVSYHDCRRLGGTCGQVATGGYDCIYPGVDACDGDMAPSPTCSGGKLGVCVLGARVETSAPKLCP